MVIFNGYVKLPEGRLEPKFAIEVVHTHHVASYLRTTLLRRRGFGLDEIVAWHWN